MKLVSEAEFSSLIGWASSNSDLSKAAVDHLYSLTFPKLQKRSTDICERIAHLGWRGVCEHESCERAWMATFHVLVDRCFGLPAVNTETMGDHPAVAHLPFQPPHPSPSGPAKRSALARQPGSVREWNQLVHGRLHDVGVETDSLRRWNLERGLAVRLDQKAYVRDRNERETPIMKRFREEWSGVKLPSNRSIPPISDSDFLTIVRILYFDACQWGYLGELVTRRRVQFLVADAVSLTHEWQSFLKECDEEKNELVQVLEAFLQCLRRACQETSSHQQLDTPLHPMYDHFTKAWTMTRFEPTRNVIREVAAYAVDHMNRDDDD